MTTHQHAGSANQPAVSTSNQIRVELKSPPGESALGVDARSHTAPGPSRCPMSRCIDGLYYGAICPTCGGRGYLNV